MFAHPSGLHLRRHRVHRLVGPQHAHPLVDAANDPQHRLDRCASHAVSFFFFSARVTDNPPPLPFRVRIVLLGYFLRGTLFDTSEDFSWYISERRRAPLLHPSVDKVDSKEQSTAFEGAEWLNGLLDVVWPVIDQQLFATAIDLIEDEMKAMTPAIVVRSRFVPTSLPYRSRRISS